MGRRPALTMRLTYEMRPPLVCVEQWRSQIPLAGDVCHDIHWFIGEGDQVKEPGMQLSMAKGSWMVSKKQSSFRGIDRDETDST